MKKTLLVYILLIAAFALYVFRYEQSERLNGAWEEKGLRGSIGETYMMITSSPVWSIGKAGSKASRMLGMPWG